LKAQPKIGTRSEEAGESQSGVCGNAPFSPHDLGNPRYRNIDTPGQRIRGEAQGAHEFLLEDFSGMDRFELLRRHCFSSVIVRDFDLKGISIAPKEADPPLVVDPDAVLSLAAPLKFLQAIARRHAKILK